MRKTRPETFQLLKIQCEQSVFSQRLDVKVLPRGWRNQIPVTRAARDAWLRSRRTLLLEVPSVLVPERRNYVVNTAHPEIAKLRIAAVYQHPFDARLL